MDRNTDITNMDAPAVGSGKCADDTMLKATATFPLPSEKEGNVLKEYTTPALPKGKLGGKGY
jgi:hypothetical protein